MFLLSIKPSSHIHPVFCIDCTIGHINYQHQNHSKGSIWSMDELNAIFYPFFLDARQEHFSLHMKEKSWIEASMNFRLLKIFIFFLSDDRRKMRNIFAMRGICMWILPRLGKCPWLLVNNRQSLWTILPTYTYYNTHSSQQQDSFNILENNASYWPCFHFNIFIIFVCSQCGQFFPQFR